MVFRLSARVRRAVPFAAAALLVCALAATRLPALAAPAATDTKAALAASLESSSTAVPLAGTFGYTAHVRLDEPASYLQTRLQVMRPSGKLVYQRTMVENSAPSGPLSYSFGRDLEGLDLKPGSYPVRLNVTAEVNGSTEETEVATELLVYDAKSTPVPVVLVARVHGSPLSDPQGRFAIDPSSAEAEVPRADVDRISALVMQDPGARIVLGVPPVLLAEWKRLSGGYTLADGTGVPAESPVARRYADTLTRLRAALDTGRLELVGLGYADPDLSALVRGIACSRHRPAVRRRHLGVFREHGDHAVDRDRARRRLRPAEVARAPRRAGRRVRGHERVLRGLGQGQVGERRVPGDGLADQRARHR